MTYNKPELVIVGSAVNIVQGVDKPPRTFRDNKIPHPLNATMGAYEADE